MDEFGVDGGVGGGEGAGGDAEVVVGGGLEGECGCWFGGRVEEVCEPGAVDAGGESGGFVGGEGGGFEADGDGGDSCRVGGSDDDAVRAGVEDGLMGEGVEWGEGFVEVVLGDGCCQHGLLGSKCDVADGREDFLVGGVDGQSE